MITHYHPIYDVRPSLRMRLEELDAVIWLMDFIDEQARQWQDKDDIR